MKSSAIIEFNGWHGECIYSQLLFLKSKGYSVTLVCNEKLRRFLGEIDIADKVIYIDSSLKSFLTIRQYLIKNSIHRVIFNTAQGDKVMKFMLLPFPARIKFYGIIHDTRKLRGSIGQKIISRKVKNYFVLADYVNQNFPAIKGLRHKSITTSFLPEYPCVDVDKGADEIWILIAGAVEFARRDYMALLDQGGSYNKEVKFIILGNSNAADGPRLKEMIAERGLQSSFTLFDSFVPNDLFYSYARKCDYVMMLIHSHSVGYEEYLKYKITGSLNIAIALRKPLLCDGIFQNIADYKDHSIFYTRQQTLNMVNSLQRPSREQFFDEHFESQYNIETQSDRYVDFIEQP